MVDQTNQVLLRIDDEMAEWLDVLMDKTNLGRNRQEVIRTILLMWQNDPDGEKKYLNTFTANKGFLAGLPSRRQKSVEKRTTQGGDPEKEPEK